MADFYKTVPDGMQANLEYRLEIARKCQKDAGMRRAVIEACTQDLVYFCKAWLWLYEPRVRYDADGYRLPHKIPFIPWQHQIEPFQKIRAALGVKDVIITKSRDEGYSWAITTFALHDWLFHPMSKVGIVSSTEALSDDPGNLDSIMAKLDWQVDCLPEWMAGRKGKGRTDGDFYRNLGDHSLVRTDNGAQINAFAATADTGRGGRYLWFALDEHASDNWKKENKDQRVLDSTQSATNSRLFVSTPNGTDGAYYKIVHEPSGENARLRINVSWRDNPTKNRGIYTLERNVPIAVDPENNPLPPHYNPPTDEILDLFSRLRKKGFILEGKIRSPWYDNECDRPGSTPQSIAKEQDLDFGGSMFRIFGPEVCKIAERGVRDPDIVGSLSVLDDLTFEFARDPMGQIKLWCPLDSRNSPPHRDYIVCADVAAGQGGSYSSNSVVIVIDTRTKEQVLEFASNTIKPDIFADLAVAIAHWFHDAYLAWEHMGPGISFGAQVLHREYHNLFYRKVQARGRYKATEKLGFHNQGEARELLFGDLHNKLLTQEVIIRSKLLLEELGQYVREQGEIKHVGAKTATDDSQRAAHGDRVIAIGVGVQAMKDRPLGRAAAKKQDQENEPPPGSIAYRRWLAKQGTGKAGDLWDHRSSRDLLESAT